jgi:hypothetical protein
MNVTQFLNRVCRSLEVPDFRELSVSDKQSVIDCTNNALGELHQWLPTHMKQGTDGATLSAPTTYSSSALPTTPGGRSVMVSGDTSLNRYRNDSDGAGAGADLLYTAAGTSHLVYGDVVRLSDRVKTVNTIYVVGNPCPLYAWDGTIDETAATTGVPSCYRIETVDAQARADNDDDSIYTLNEVSLYLRVWPMPSAATRISYRVEFAPATITLSDTFQNISETTGVETPSPSLPVLGAFQGELLALAEEELSYLNIFIGDPNKARLAADRARERLSREPTRPDAGGKSFARTPKGW